MRRDSSGWVGRGLRSQGLLRGARWLGLLVLAWLALQAGAQTLDDPEVELEDVIAVDLVGRDLYAYNLLGTNSPYLRLEIGENVHWMDASGRVAVVVTDRRLLAVTNRNAGWQEERLRVHETRPERALIGKRVALVVTNNRLLGYDSQSGLWLQADVGPNERVADARVGAQTALVLTNRSAYGLSPEAGGFFRTPISIQENVGRVRVAANMVTISTSRRVLVFRAPVGVWTEERRNIN